MEDYFKLTEDIVVSNLKQILTVSIEREDNDEYLIIYYRNRKEPLKLKIKKKDVGNLIDLLIKEIDKRNREETEFLRLRMEEMRNQRKNRII